MSTRSSRVRAGAVHTCPAQHAPRPRPPPWPCDGRALVLRLWARSMWGIRTLQDVSYIWSITPRGALHHMLHHIARSQAANDTLPGRGNGLAPEKLRHQTPQGISAVPLCRMCVFVTA